MKPRHARDQKGHAIMWKRTLRTLLLAAGFLWLGSANADCLWQGKSYPTGTRIGGLTCQADGSWK
jgi:hypothetical protein